jgi:hypothetical protein
VQIDFRVQGVARAEKALEQGKNADAAAMVVRMIPHIRNYKSTTRDEIINRAMRVLAVATARSDGKLDFAKQVSADARGEWTGEKAEQRTANLEWSVQALRAIDKKKKDDRAVQSELGEALAKLDNGKGEARELLGKLAEKDLLTSPEAYAALAKLRTEAGDKNGGESALKRCEAMSKTPAMCRATAAVATGSAVGQS